MVDRLAHYKPSAKDIIDSPPVQLDVADLLDEHDPAGELIVPADANSTPIPLSVKMRVAGWDVAEQLEADYTYPVQPPLPTPPAPEGDEDAVAEALPEEAGPETPPRADQPPMQPPTPPIEDVILGDSDIEQDGQLDTARGHDRSPDPGQQLDTPRSGPKLYPQARVGPKRAAPTRPRLSPRQLPLSPDALLEERLLAQPRQQHQPRHVADEFVPETPRPYNLRRRTKRPPSEQISREGSAKKHRE